MQESRPRPIPGRTILQIPPATVLPPPSSASKIRNAHLNLDTFSPVNQNGSFEFDRVLKCGFVQKRTRKTKVGLPSYNLLIIFANSTAGLEVDIPSPTAQLPLDIQRSERRQAKTQDPSIGTYCRGLSERSQAKTPECLRPILSFAELSYGS